MQIDDDLDALVHVYMANRGILLTPFHSMVLISPATTVEDVDLHNRVFGEMVKELFRAQAFPRPPMS